MFGHKVGPNKTYNRFLQCCFNAFIENKVIYTCWSMKLVQNTGFCRANIPNPSFLSVFPLPKTSQNDPKLHLHTFLTSNTQKSSKKHENTNRIRLAPPAKADIATAILTNVTWAFSVAVCTPISTPSPPAVWLDLKEAVKETASSRILRQRPPGYAHFVNAFHRSLRGRTAKGGGFCECSRCPWALAWSKLPGIQEL